MKSNHRQQSRVAHLWKHLIQQHWIYLWGLKEVHEFDALWHHKDLTEDIKELTDERVQ